MQATETACKNNQMSDLIRYFKVAINMFTELQETMIEEVKEGVMMLQHIESINKEKLWKRNRWKL